MHKDWGAGKCSRLSHKATCAAMYCGTEMFCTIIHFVVCLQFLLLQTVQHDVVNMYHRLAPRKTSGLPVTSSKLITQPRHHHLRRGQRACVAPVRALAL